MEKKRMKRWKKIVIIAVAFLALAGVLGGIVLNPYFLQTSQNEPTLGYTETLTRAKAMQDIDYVMWQLNKVHPACLRGTAAEFSEAYERETALLGETVTVNELNGAIARILSSMGDAHTSAFTRRNDTRYMLYTYENQSAGLRLTKINGMTLWELFQKNKGIYSYETEDYGFEQMTWRLSEDSGLALLGIDINDGVTYTYEDAEGNETDFTYYAKDFVPYEEYSAYYDSVFGQGGETSFVYYEIDKENSIGVFTLTSCRYNGEYKAAVDSFFKEVKESGIENIAVDVRGNGGGNSMVVNYFFRYLDADEYFTEGQRVRVGPFLFGNSEPSRNKNDKIDGLTFTGDLYLLTSISSFSSAMMFAEYVKDNDLGTIVGEAPGNDPSGYGDIATFMTPNAHIYFSVSIKDFTRADKSKDGQLITPDIECESKEALDKVYALIAA